MAFQERKEEAEGDGRQKEEGEGESVPVIESVRMHHELKQVLH